MKKNQQMIACEYAGGSVSPLYLPSKTEKYVAKYEINVVNLPEFNIA